MTNGKELHPCIHAQGDNGKGAYICALTGFNCTSQFYCHEKYYWRPSYQIKCTKFIDKNAAQKPDDIQGQKNNVVIDNNNN